MYSSTVAVVNGSLSREELVHGRVLQVLVACMILMDDFGIMFLLNHFNFSWVQMKWDIAFGGATIIN